MDDHVLPLDLTIYGAIHQHEARKTTGATASSSAIWQGVYPVKFRKIMAPAPDGEYAEYLFLSPADIMWFVPKVLSSDREAGLQLLLPLLQMTPPIPRSYVCCACYTNLMPASAISLEKNGMPSPSPVS